MTKLNIFALLVSTLLLINCANNDEHWWYSETTTSIGIDCAVAQEELSVAYNNYQNATEETQFESCISYEYALQNVIDICGDTDSFYQNLLDNLGSCEVSCAEIEQNTQESKAYYESLSEEDEDYEIACNGYAYALQTQIQLCGSSPELIEALTNLPCDVDLEIPVGSISFSPGEVQLNSILSVTEEGSAILIVAQNPETLEKVTMVIPNGQTGNSLINSFTYNVDGNTYNIFNNPPNGSTPFGSNISVNSGEEITGTFYGTLKSANGATLDMYSGVIDIHY